MHSKGHDNIFNFTMYSDIFNSTMYDTHASETSPAACVFTCSGFRRNCFRSWSKSVLQRVPPPLPWTASSTHELLTASSCPMRCVFLQHHYILVSNAWSYSAPYRKVHVDAHLLSLVPTSLCSPGFHQSLSRQLGTPGPQPPMCSHSEVA